MYICTLHTTDAACQSNTITAYAWHPKDDNLLAVCTNDNVVHLYNIAEDTETKRSISHAASPCWSNPAKPGTLLCVLVGWLQADSRLTHGLKASLVSTCSEYWTKMVSRVAFSNSTCTSTCWLRTYVCDAASATLTKQQFSPGSRMTSFNLHPK